MASIDECISLLSGPSDERRFVGLLLVAKLLPSEDCSSALRIWEAIGSSFLKRMLLPVTSAAQVRGPEPSKDKIELHLMSCSVATAVLNSLCRFENISKLDQILEFLPLISQVWRNRARLKRWALHSGNEIIKGIFQDILGVFLATSSGSEQGKKKTVEHNGMEVALWALEEWKGDRNQIILMATSLVSNLLEGNALDRINLLQGNDAGISEAVQSISQLLVLGFDKGSPSSEKSEETDKVDPAMLQLEALHALLLIFPLPLPQAENVRDDLIGSQSEWWGRVRLGLTSILQSKTTLVQRHSALQLAAAMTELMGSDWLVKPYGEKIDSNDLMFFRLVVEIVSIEVPVLLRDVVEPSDVESMVEKMAETSISGQYEEEGPSAMEGGVPLPSMGRPSSSSQSESPPPKQDKILSETRRSAALRTLPICFWLIEAVLDVLTASENLLEEMTTGPPVCGLVSPMDDAVALRTINSITEIIGHVLEYVSEWKKLASEGKAQDDCLLVACSRCVGRFLADIPIAHMEAVKTCCEVLVRCGDMHEGVEFMTPGLLQLTGGEDAKVWSNLCSRKPIFDAILERAGFLCKQSAASVSTQIASGNDHSSMAIYSESKMGMLFHLLANIVLGVTDSAFQSDAPMSVKVMEAAIEWFKKRMGYADVDVLLVVALVSALFVKGVHEQGEVTDQSEKLVEEALECVLNAVEIGHKGLVANEVVFQQECGDTWERLVHFMTTLIEVNPKALSQAKTHIYIQNGIRQFDSEGVACVEDVSWQLLLKTIQMGDTHM
ncbi:hypothetical protein BSKO_07614 [Bryopsis sp. KO-2023]|nr:hypothetical protein BSKO_07614 [Bryopsis sp. KO-2023]